MIRNFVAFNLSKELYQHCKGLRLQSFLYDQLIRASASVSLNLAEGSGKQTPREQKRYYGIALGSLRECEAVFELENINDPKIRGLTNQLGAILFKLARKADPEPGTATSPAALNSKLEP